MKVVNKQGKLAAIALALGLGVCAGSSVTFAQDVDEMKETFSNGVVAISEGVFDFSGCQAVAGFTAPASMLYMRAQDPLVGAPLDTIDAAQTQMDAGSVATEQDSDKTFWASPYYSSFVGKRRGKTSYVESEDFKMKRVGFMGGVEKNFTARTKMGFYLGYSRIGMSQGYGVADESDREEEFNEKGEVVYWRQQDVVNHKFDPEIDAVDFQFGGNFTHTFANDWTVCTNLIGGAQNYAWSRLASVDVVTRDSEGLYDLQPYEELYQGCTTGNTLSVNVELSKNYAMGAGWTLTPGLAIESAHSWIWEGGESGTNGVPDSAIKNGEDWDRWELGDDVTLSRTTARVGAAFAYDDDNWGFNTKAFYGTVLGDNAKYGAQNEGTRFSATGSGIGYGNDTLKLGGGLWMALNPEKTMTLGGAYDATLYKHATSQTASGTFTTRF